MPLTDADTLKNLGLLALKKAGVPQAAAEIQLDLLWEAELRGVPSHGFLRLDRILKRIANGVADPYTTGRHEWLSDSFLSVDGERGLGPVVAKAALDALMERASATGVAVGAVRNSNHIGMLGWYTEHVASKGLTAIALSTSEALVHPWGGRKAMLGTNPISIGVPTESGPFMMDTATSIVSMGEIHDRAHRGESIPPGWALDAEGLPTTDPEEAKQGSLAPFGEAKGYALGLAFELMVSSLAGSAIGREVRGTLDDTEVCNKGDLFIVMKGRRRDAAEYIEAIRKAEPAEGFQRVIVPGERGRLCRDDRLAQGVPLAQEVWDRLRILAGDQAAA